MQEGGLSVGGLKAGGPSYKSYKLQITSGKVKVRVKLDIRLFVALVVTIYPPRVLAYLQPACSLSSASLALGSGQCYCYLLPSWLF